MELSELVSARRYTKGNLTRLFNFVSNDENVANSLCETLLVKRNRALELFSEYEKYNLKILGLDEEDKEDVSLVEEHYFHILAILNAEIKARESQNTKPSKPPSAPISKLKLPPINVPIFSGKLTEYIPFINLFNSVINDNDSIDFVQKLYYLRTYLRDEPLHLIKNLPLTQESYTKALALLNDRYNNSFRIINEHITTILDLKPISKSTASNLREFVSNVKQELAALTNLDPNVRYWDAIILCVLCRKLDIYTSRAYQIERDTKMDPTVEDFLSFIDKRALALENAEPAYGQPHQQHKEVREQRPGLSTGKLAAYTAAQEASCLFCKSNHKLYLCQSFQLLPANKRVQFADEKGICHVCLGAHAGKCRFHFRCTECKQRHHTLLHCDNDKVNNQQAAASPASLAANNLVTNNVLLPTAQVKLLARDGTEMTFKALLDSGSQLSFISQKAVQLLDLKPLQSNINIVGIVNTQASVKRCVPVEIHSLVNPFKLSTTCHVVDQITCELPQRKLDLSDFAIPLNIRLADKDFNIPSQIDLLMGADCFFQALLPPESTIYEPAAPLSGAQLSTPGARHPQLINTQFGYIIGGSLPSNVCNQVAVLKCVTCESDIIQNLDRFWKSESVPEIYNEKSSEQELCEYIFQKTVQLKDDCFEVALPLKLPLEDVNDALGNSFHFALKRFLNLEKKLHKDHNLFLEYQKFIHDYLNLNHGHFVDIESYQLSKDAVYFLPHHAVLKPDSKTTKLRTVFDASMKTSKKVSLNDLLLNGPTVQRDLFDILLLFRFGDYTFTTDIKQMFRNIRVIPEHTSLQNILWRDSPDETIKCIRLDTVTYGLKSSSYLATRCLKELAMQNEREMPLASFILNNCAYVDDVLYSNSNLDLMLEAKSQLQRLLQMGSFKTHKWSSNDSRILEDIPSTDRHFDDLEFQNDDCSIKTLGLQLVVHQDKFKITSPEFFDAKNITKREILAYIGKFYDPMGFVGPTVVQAKAIMQKLWSSKTDWDAAPDENIKTEWLQFLSSLAKMDPIYIDRNIQLSDADSVELIGFSDASSSTAYGCCVYLRVTDNKGKVHMHLLCSKSRINPLQNKNLTVPRLELNAALLLSILIAKVSNTLKLKLKINQVYLFTDSQIVLAWLRSEAMKLTAYVANRVKAITSNTAGCQWLYVNTKDNPADYISRGVSPHELSDCDMWWHGPRFLYDSKYMFNQSIELPSNLPESRSSAAISSNVGTAARPVNDVLQGMHKYSSIHKMVRILAYMLRFINNLKGSKVSHNYLLSSELNFALMLLIKFEQEFHFHEEIECLSKKQSLKGSLQSLHPFLDNLGMLRVGGRLHHANIPYTQKHQAILPKQSYVTECIVRSEHERLLHAGPRLLLSNLNQKYWITNGLLYVKKITNKCVKCFRQKATASKQLMGSLPAGRVTALSRPFEKVGVDFAGPVNVKLSRVRRSVIGKGYICVFVCFATKAIHLELASDLTTDTYLACLRRLISRRGLPKEIYSDNASTFKGARNQLVEIYNLFSSRDHQSKVFQFTAQKGIDFHFIPSYSPTFGGLWEAAVKSTKYHLRRVVQGHLLTYEQLNTVLVEIECVLNSRPLLPISSSDVNDYSYLTPGHFLIGNALTMYPENDISNVPQNRLKFWQLCTQIKQSFWKMWHKQYLNVLQNRPKWLNISPNIKIGTLVILREDNVPVMFWPMARVVNTYPGHDGHVRAVEVKTSNGKTHTRSIFKICVLPLDT